MDFGIKSREERGVRGVLVTDVAADSPAAAAGLKVGDRIVSLDGRLTSNREALDRELARQAPGNPFAFQVIRNGKLITAEVGLKDPRGLANNGATGNGVTGDAAKESGSLLSGFGSMLGGLMGGKANAKGDASANKRDEMAFGDEEPVEQAAFEEEIHPAVEKLQRDPPSLETLPLPPAEAKPVESSVLNRRAEELREEIRLLEQRLKELEAKQ
jgi:membrane-associated protease RseP (regulator of RpoE activity)